MNPAYSMQFVHIKNFKRAIAVAALICWLAINAHATPGTDQVLGGGGAQASVGAYRLNGVVADYGPTGGGITASGTHRLGVGFYPSLAGLIASGYNAAAAIWLEVSSAWQLELEARSAQLAGADTAAHSSRP